MSDPALATSPQFETRTVPAKYVEILYRDGIKDTFTVLEIGESHEHDTFKMNEFAMEIRLMARPNCPKLQRPLEERITIFKVNVMRYSVIADSQEVDFKR